MKSYSSLLELFTCSSPIPAATVAAADGSLAHRGGRVHARRIREENPLILHLEREAALELFS